MKHLRWVGSIRIAVPLLVVIAAVLAYGTIYETRFGTAAVQRFVYQAWWFQALLAFLCANLTVSALQRWPWKPRHAPFLLAHLGIILILVGGIIGARWAVEGQLIIPEGQAERVLLLPQTVLSVEQPAGQAAPQLIPTRYDTRAWEHEPNHRVPLVIGDQAAELRVDRYYPNAQFTEVVTGDGDTDNPAIELVLGDDAQEDSVWLFSRDPERGAVGWGSVHALFVEPAGEDQARQLFGLAGGAPAHPRGVVVLAFEALGLRREVPVPADLSRPVPVDGTPYTIQFKDYFPDFAILEHGVGNRSEEPNNPAVSFVLNGPEGSDAHLLFALHPDFAAMHGRQHTIPAQATFQHAGSASVPPQAIAIVRHASGALTALLTGDAGQRHVAPVEVGRRYQHPWTETHFTVRAARARAAIRQDVSNKNDQIKREALHVTLQRGQDVGHAWLTMDAPTPVAIGGHDVVLTYARARREVPVTIKLLDFRKIDYPGTQTAAGFEADVQLTDSPRGLILMRTIKMNQPLKYRGWTFYQASFVPAQQPGAPETTVLAVKNDPGTPIVYAGFCIVILGVVWMFVGRSPWGRAWLGRLAPPAAATVAVPLPATPSLRVEAPSLSSSVRA
jgi:hypothetical protein